MSETKRAYMDGGSSAPSPRALNGRPAFGSTKRAIDAPGLRSEELITVGQYTPVLRSFAGQ